MTKRNFYDESDFVYEIDGEVFIDSKKEKVLLTRPPTDQESNYDDYGGEQDWFELQGEDFDEKTKEGSGEVHIITGTYPLKEFFKLAHKIKKLVKKK